MVAATQTVIRLLGLLLAGLLLAGCGGSGEQLTLPSALPVVTAGEAYRGTLFVTGGHGPFQWDVSADELPPGLTLNPETGVIEGQAWRIGRYPLHVTVRDAAYGVGSAVVRMEVIAADSPMLPEPSRNASQLAGKTLPANAPVNGLLSLLAAMPEGSWVQASLNRYSDVWTPEELRPLDVNGMGATVPSKIIVAWSGFAWDSNRGDLILYGGGHANYPGNDVYRWRGSTRLWERAALPSEITRDASGNFIAIDGPDAAPAAAHTYDSNIFFPVIDRFLTFGGAAYNNGGAYRRATTPGQSRNTGPYLWDPAKADSNKVGGTTGSHVKRVSPHAEVAGGQMWQNRDLVLNLASNPILPVLHHLEGCTGYANEGGVDVAYVGARVGYGTATYLFRYAVPDVNNPRLDSWTQVGGYWDSPQGQTVCTYDPVQKIFVKLGNAGVPFTYWDTTASTGNSNYEKIITFSEPTGEFLARLADGRINIRYCGFDFDPVRSQYALWCGGAEVWMLTPPASVSPTGWTLKRQTIAAGGGATPTSDTGTGVLGKWKYIPNLDAFMALQDSIAGNVWIYKPFGWKSPGGTPTNQPPTVGWITPTDGQQFTQGQAIVLQANASDADGSVAAVDFYDNSTLLAHVTSAPWRVNWSNAALGPHALSAVAYDNMAASQSTPTVNIQVVAQSGGEAVVAVLQDGLNGYAATRDANLVGVARNTNFGTTTSMIDNYTYYAMMVRFAIFQREGGPVPDNAVISAAELELYKSTFYAVTVSAYRLLCDWQEMQVTWSACRTGVAWSTPGALGVGTDYQAVADGYGLGVWDPGWVKIDVSAGLIAMQQGSPNYGWRLRRTGGDDINTKRYYAHEYADNASLRPRLVVHYALP